MELLAPVGNFEMLSAAIEAGADSVYFGTKLLNMRANANNFELTELKKVVQKCHDDNVKAYLTINTIVYDDELEKAELIIKTAKEAQIDAIICWDMSVLQVAKNYGLEVHISTQASISNFESLKFYYDLGVKRFILARELSLGQIKSIADKIKLHNLDAEIETFCHGAMCVAVSGRCFTSQFLFRRSANKGDCLQPCRRSYKVTDLETSDELVLENSFVMSAKDLCTLPFIEKLKNAGITAFKIEGRNKAPEYVRKVVEVYREALDNELSENRKNELLEKLKTVYNRKFSSGFYLGLPTNDDFADLYGSDAAEKKTYIGFVKNYYKQINVAEVKVESENIKLNDKILVTGPTTGAKYSKVKSMQINHEDIEKAEKGKSIAIKLDFIARPNDKVFVITP